MTTLRPPAMGAELCAQQKHCEMGPSTPMSHGLALLPTHPLLQQTYWPGNLALCGTLRICIMDSKTPAHEFMKGGALHTALAKVLVKRWRVTAQRLWRGMLRWNPRNAKKGHLSVHSTEAPCGETAVSNPMTPPAAPAPWCA